MEKFHSESIIENLKQVGVQKKELAHFTTAYYQQLLFYSLTLSAVFRTLNNNFRRDGSQGYGTLIS
jgi:hypothetical protein